MVAFPRKAITDRLHGNIDTLLKTFGAGRGVAKLFLDEIYSPGASGNSSPLLKTLFPEVKLAAMIERSLNTALGRGLDHMVADIARSAHGNAQTNYSVSGSLPTTAGQTIGAIVESYTSGEGHAVPDTAAELALVLPGVGAPGARENVLEKDDVYFESSDGTENHIEIKTPKPNYDQGRASKRRILRIHAVRAPKPVQAFVGMPYNPNGLFGTYQWPTTKYFLDPSNDLKVGQQFWNYVGNSDGTYDELLDCFLEVSGQRRGDLLDVLKEV